MNTTLKNKFLILAKDQAKLDEAFGESMRCGEESGCPVVIGYDKEPYFPPVAVLRQFAGRERAYWAGSLLISLLEAFKSNEQIRQVRKKYLGGCFDPATAFERQRMPETWIEYIYLNPEKVFAVLDGIDEWLEREQQEAVALCNHVGDLPVSYTRALLRYWQT